MFKTLNGLAPEYLPDMLLMYAPSRPLRSSGTGLLVVPWVRTETDREAAFSVHGPRLWTRLPQELRSSQSVNTFNRNLKTYLFSSAFP